MALVFQSATLEQTQCLQQPENWDPVADGSFLQILLTDEQECGARSRAPHSEVTKARKIAGTKQQMDAPREKMTEVAQECWKINWGQMSDSRLAAYQKVRATS